jgi:micrococcal nuclease
MLRKWYILAILVIGASAVTIVSISAEESLVPSWIKTTVGFWVSGNASDQEFLNTIKWLVENNVIKVDSASDKANSQQLQSKIITFQDENQKLRASLEELKKQNAQSISAKSPSYYDPAPKSSRVDTQGCSGYAACFSGQVTQVVDGDTIKVDSDSIRFALVNTPEVGEYGYGQAKDFIGKICPPGSTVLVDEDDLQTQGSYGRMIAVVYCNGMNLNKAILDQGYGKIETSFCSKSEFADESWAYDCAAKQYTPPTKSEQPKSVPPKTEPPKTEPPKSEPPQTEPTETTSSCDPSYPDVCIPSPPPDLDCGEISYKNFKVIGSDPHRFDGDHDGIGCES